MTDVERIRQITRELALLDDSRESARRSNQRSYHASPQAMGRATRQMDEALRLIAERADLIQQHAIATDVWLDDEGEERPEPDEFDWPEDNI